MYFASKSPFPSYYIQFILWLNIVFTVHKIIKNISKWFLVLENLTLRSTSICTAYVLFITNKFYLFYERFG